MNRLLKKARSAGADTAVQFRKTAYGSSGLCQILRDILAMANATTDRPRWIFTGIEADAQGNHKIHPVSPDDVSGKPSYQSLVADFSEPPVRVRYRSLSLEGERIRVCEISNCADRPYMTRADFSETLRRGDAYVRVQDSAAKMGRRQLQDLFEKRFNEAVAAENIEIGFPGEIMHKILKLPTVDLSVLPSAQAAAKLQL